MQWSPDPKREGKFKDINQIRSISPLRVRFYLV